jgi:hypothetical protein
MLYDVPQASSSPVQTPARALAALSTPANFSYASDWRFLSKSATAFRAASIFALEGRTHSSTFPQGEEARMILNYMEIPIVRTSIRRAELEHLAAASFGDFVKAVVDVDRGIMAIGGEMHADEEQELLDDGSAQENLWGINLYPGLPPEQWIEFDSMINVRPRLGNRSRDVENITIRQAIREVVTRLVRD